MKLWLISEAVSRPSDRPISAMGSAVVAAETAREAQEMHPSGPKVFTWSRGAYVLAMRSQLSG